MEYKKSSHTFLIYTNYFIVWQNFGQCINIYHVGMLLINEPKIQLVSGGLRVDRLTTKIYILSLVFKHQTSCCWSFEPPNAKQRDKDWLRGTAKEFGGKQQQQIA